MNQLPWLLVLVTMILLTLHWLLAWSTIPLSRQAIRQFFLQRLLSTVPGIALLSESDDIVIVQARDLRCSCRLTQLYRRCTEQPARTAIFVRQAVQAIHDAIYAEATGLPADWEQRVTIHLLNRDVDLPSDLVTRAVVDTLAMGYTLADEEAFRWVTFGDLTPAGVSEDALHAAAMRTLERSCNRLIIDAAPATGEEEDELLRFQTGDGLDAARIVLPSFYNRFAPRFGDQPLAVAIPTRDTLAIVCAADARQAGWLAWRTAQLHARQAFPLCANLLLVTEQGYEHWQPGATVGVDG